MTAKSAITKLQALLIVNVVIVMLAAGAYLYIESIRETIRVSSVRPAEFIISGLTIYPAEAEVDEPVSVSVNITNIGDEAGNYTLSLLINGVAAENRTISLSGANSTIVEFALVFKDEGNYTIAVGNLTGNLRVKAPTLPEGIIVSELMVRPYEAWVGETIRITARVSNQNDYPVNCSIRLEVNGTRRDSKSVQLAAKASTQIEFDFVAEKEGMHYIKVGQVKGGFKIVPTGMHTLVVSSSPSGVEFTINGKAAKTPYSELVPVGTTFTITFPKEHIISRTQPTWQFRSWEDGSTDPTRTITLRNYTSITATYQVLASCPALHVWNGSDYIYVTEVSDGTGYLGILDHFMDNGSMVFAYSYPWDYIKLERVQPQPRNGYYDFLFVQKADEIFYIDSVTLVVVDHPADVDVYSTKATYIYNLEEQGRIYTVGKNLRAPVSAVDGNGRDVLPFIVNLDGVYTEGHEFQWDTLELNLGDLSDAKEIKLVVAGTIFYSPGNVQGEWAAQFVDKPGVRPFPPPYMEVKNANGNWVPVPDSRQFPLCDVGTDIFVVNLTGLFPTNDYSLRIHTFFDTRFDFIAVDTTPQQSITIMEVHPVSAQLSQAFPTNSTSSGNFTRYGDVTALLLEADDKFVIGRQGDQIHVLFPADLPPQPEGMKRSFFIFVSCWFKVKGLPYLSFTVDPLPFHKMSCFPYPPTEKYPYDEDHLSYLFTYNTRLIKTP